MFCYKWTHILREIAFEGFFLKTMEATFSAIYWTQVISTISCSLNRVGKQIFRIQTNSSLILAQLYLKDTTLCLIWPANLEFGLKTSNFREFYTVININMNNLEDSFANDVADFESLKKQFDDNGIYYNALTMKLSWAIEKAHCESFFAFQEDILPFIESFINASQYSNWRSKRNRFVFGYSATNYEEIFARHKFFADQPAILLLTGDASLNHIFHLKTNKFHGPKSQHQAALLLLDQYNALSGTFLYNHSLFPDKTRNLRGREIIVTGFDYRPYFVINYVTQDNNSYDVAWEDGAAKGAAQIDGTEARVLTAFCEIYNCTILIDSSEATDWGEVYPNLTGDYSLGMVIKDRAEITIGSMYSWDSVYLQLDMSMYLVRTGVTCLVPAPKRLASWLLPLQPFQLTLWLAVLFYVFIEMIVLCFTYRFEMGLTLSSGSWLRSLRYGFVTAVRLFLSQSSEDDVQSVTVRVFLFACFMNDIIITSIYGGGLASILTIPSYEKAADTIDGMLYYKLKWLGISDAWTVTLRTADDPRMDALLHTFYSYTGEELEQLALTRFDVAFALERLPFGHYAIGDFLPAASIKHLKIMKEDLYFQYTVAFAKRCWPLLERFDQLIYFWHSAGLDKYWEWRVVAANLNAQTQKQVEASMYSNLDDAGPEKLAMSNFIGMLLIWFAGVLISLLAFLYELLTYNYKRKTGCFKGII